MGSGHMAGSGLSMIHTGKRVGYRIQRSCLRPVTFPPRVRRVPAALNPQPSSRNWREAFRNESSYASADGGDQVRGRASGGQTDSTRAHRLREGLRSCSTIRPCSSSLGAALWVTRCHMSSPHGFGLWLPT